MYRSPVPLNNGFSQDPSDIQHTTDTRNITILDPPVHDRDYDVSILLLISGFFCGVFWMVDFIIVSYCFDMM